jgi:hypothetical protein
MFIALGSPDLPPPFGGAEFKYTENRDIMKTRLKAK